MISALLGGIGLFLLGMTLMTEGLKATAGGALRDLLGRFTGGPLRSFASGAALTALIQSSSATIVTTIGFVSAGLLGFQQAIGVIFGAAVGTTSTGWLVAFLGLKYSVSVVALPLVGLGALLRILGRGRLASFGLVLAGFGLIFVGIDALQGGMAALAERIDLGAIRGDRILGILLLVGTGIVMTVVMQSSSAAVATTLAAVHAGTIDIAQAAALVVGQNAGTTVTAAIASLGASVPARRTAVTHILLNSFSGVVALLLLPAFALVLAWSQRSFGLGPAEQIALFHTSFNLIGVAILLPQTERFARLVVRLVPERRRAMTNYLDDSVRALPPVAVEAARRTVVEIAAAVFEVARQVLQPRGIVGDRRDPLAAAREALGRTRAFLGGVRTSPEMENEHRRHLAVLHALDHVERMIEALEEVPAHDWLTPEGELHAVAAGTAGSLVEPLAWLRAGGRAAPAPDLADLSRSTAEQRRLHRPEVMARTAAGKLPPEVALRTLDAMRWIDRVVYHIWRTVHHLAAAGGAASSPDVETYEDRPGELSPLPGETGVQGSLP
jgi:phosphate:Na+ symporter